MFTGIVQDIGEIAAVEKRGDWLVAVKTRLQMSRMSVGATIACDGIRLAVVERGFDCFKVELSAEILNATAVTHWQPGAKINLEPSLRAGDELEGHLLTGQVDGLAYVIGKRPDGDDLHYHFEAPPEFARFLTPKGTVALNGVSLPVKEVRGREFGVAVTSIIQKKTTMGALEVGATVNFEADMIMRYIERLISFKAAT